MKKLFACLLLLAMLLLTACGEEEPIEDIPSDDDTPATDSSVSLSATLTEIGQLTYSVQANICIGGKDKDGKPRLYCGVNGDSYATFQIVDPQSGKLLKTHKLATGKSVYELFVHSSGDVYIAVNSSAAIYRYDVKTGLVGLVMQLDYSPTAMCEDGQGNIVCGLVGSDQFLYYDLKNNTTKLYSVPNLKAVGQYATAYNKKDGSYYVVSRDSEGHSALYRYKSLDERGKDILPAKYRDIKAYIFDINIIGDRLVCQTSNGDIQLMVLNPTTGKSIDVICRDTDEKVKEIPCTIRSLSPLSPDGECFYFADANRKICRYNLTNDTYQTVAGLSVWSIVLNWDYFNYQNDLCLVGLDGYNGDAVEYNIDKETVRHFTVPLEGWATTIDTIDMDENGVIFGGSLVRGAGNFDINSGESTRLLGMPGVNGICATSRYVFYTHAVKAGVEVLAYDRSKPWNMTDMTATNPSPVCTVSSSQFPQLEAITMLLIPEEKKLVVSTAPAEGGTSGAICIIDIETLDYTVKFDLISGHIVKAMAYSGGNLYLATSSVAGDSAAQMVVCDLKTEQYTYVGDLDPNMHGVYALTVGKDGKLWGVGYDYVLFSYDTAKNEMITDQKMTVASVASNEKIELVSTDHYLYMNCRGNQSLYAIRWKDLSLHLVKTSCGFNMRLAPDGYFYFSRNFSLFKVKVTENA